MISTYLVEHPWLTTVALLLMVTVGPLLGYWLVGHPRLALWLGFLSLLPVLALTLVPTSRDLAVGCATEWSLPTLGAALGAAIAALALGARHSVPGDR